MIYLDNAASAPPAPEVLTAMTAAAGSLFGNPSSAHGLGAAATRALDEARTQVAALLRASPQDIVFTSGGTEADALAVLGVAGAARGRHVVVSAIEHPAVLRSAELLTARGFRVTLVAPGRDGVVTAATVAAAVESDTALVAVMLVNNELGTVQPVSAIARLLAATAARPHLHVDAVQAAGFLPLSVQALGADTVAISGHKFHGPKGAGALWIRKGAKLVPLWDGGRQERGLRSGTENVPACVALGRAAALVLAAEADIDRMATLRDRLEARIFASLPGSAPTVAPGTPRAPHIASITIPDLPGEPLLHALEARGVFVSAGSACASRTRGPSHVLAAIGVPDSAAVLRLSLSRFTTSAEVDAAASALCEAVAEVAEVAGAGRRAKGRA
jgi:cysteine desulfurase